MSTSSILTDKWNMFKTGGCILFIKMLIFFFLPKTEDISHLAELTHVSVIGISEAKLDVSISSNEIGIDGYDITRIEVLENEVELLVSSNTLSLTFIKSICVLTQLKKDTHIHQN